MSLVLLTGAGLLTRSLIRMRAVQPGFETADRMTFSVSIPGARYPWPGPDADRFYRAVEAGTEDLPGVLDAGVVWPLPFSGSSWSGDVRAAADEARRTADYVLATEGYFSVMGIRMVAGRLWAEGDDRHVVAVSETLASTLWPDGAAVGRRVELDPWGRGLEPFEVVGVVADVRTRDLRVDPPPVAYFDTRSWSWVDWEVDVVARTVAPAGSVLPEIRGMVADLDPEVPVAEVATVEDYLARGSAGLRFALLLVGIFGGVALVLAAVGLYGTLAHLVGLQQREIGIRMALGSKRRQVVGLVLDRGLRLVAAGVALGLVGAFLLSGLLEAYLFGVQPGDPVTMIGVAAGLAGVGLLAALGPARRAGRVDPMTILRAE
jgi:predicted permease